MTAIIPALHYQAYQAFADLSQPARSNRRQLAPWLQQGLFWFPRVVPASAAACGSWRCPA